MRKRKRGRAVAPEPKPNPTYWTKPKLRWVVVARIVSKLDLPEVDRIIEGRRFSEKLTIPSSTPPDNTTADNVFKFQNLNTYGDKGSIEDRISHLPKEILHSIISRLTLREGARTSILSTRWKNLWREAFTCLDLDYPNMTARDCPKIVNTMSLANEGVNFARWVNQVLEGCPLPKLEALRFSYALGEECAAHIDKWVKLAAARGVEQLDLNFCPFGGEICASHLYKFLVQGSHSSLKYLNLSCCCFYAPQNLKGFSSLVSMTLHDVILTGDVVQNILSDCPSLECFSILDCRFEETYCLKFAGPSLLLKHLCLSYHHSGRMDIDLHDINLLSFEFHGRVKTLSIENTPHLTRLILNEVVRVETLTSVPHIETLFLNGWFKESSVQSRYHVNTLPRSHVFDNLKWLVFLNGLRAPQLCQFVYLLEACPLLQKLELDMGLSELLLDGETEELSEMISRPGIPHTNLKEIDIYRFECSPEKIELSQYLLKKAIFLEKMNIYSATRAYHGNGKWVVTENTVKQGRMSVKKACKLIQQEASSSTTLHYMVI